MLHGHTINLIKGYTCDNAEIGGFCASANELHYILVPHFPVIVHV